MGLVSAAAPSCQLFNAELGGNAWRAIKSFEGDEVDEKGLAGLVREGIAVNAQRPAKRKATTPSARVARKAPAKAKAKARRG